MAVKHGQLPFTLCFFCTITISCSLRFKEIIWGRKNKIDRCRQCILHLLSNEHVSFVELPARINLYYNDSTKSLSPIVKMKIKKRGQDNIVTSNESIAGNGYYTSEYIK